MSEVRRWDLCGSSCFDETECADGMFVQYEDFARVTAERDALQQDLNQRDEQIATLDLQREAHLRNSQVAERRVDELQQRLTAADERVDVLETGLKWESDRNALLLASLTEAEDMLSVTSLEAGQRIDQLERALGGMLFGFDDGVGRDWSEDLLDFARRLTPAVEFKP